MCAAQPSVWACEERGASVALSCVLCWLNGPELATVSAVCRVWRTAASAPALWRRLLHDDCAAPPRALRALATLTLAAEDIDSGTGSDDEAEDVDEEVQWSWRDEYVRCAAGWRPVCSLRPPEQAGGTNKGGAGGETSGGALAGGTLLHATLSARADAIAVTADDASVAVWARFGATAEAWRVAWRGGLRRRGWQTAARVEWAPHEDSTGARRLLVAGPLVLAERWELLVLELHEDTTEEGEWEARVLARAGCSAGAAGCWAGPTTFLSLELRLLAPHRGVTTIWLNSATQEAQSEFTGVAAPVLRVYNEAQAHLTHVAVVEVPGDTSGALNADEQYLLDTTTPRIAGGTQLRFMVAGCGYEGGQTGQAMALAVWRLGSEGVPPLCARAGGGLAERVARRRTAPRMPQDPSPPPPTEAELRALCEPPLAELLLRARLIGLTPHPGGRCVWAVEATGGCVCASLPALVRLRELQPAVLPPPTAAPHYVQPAVSRGLIVSPVGGYSGLVNVWSARSGARCTAPQLTSAGAPITAALLPSDSLLLLLSDDSLHVWESRATPQNII